MKNNEELTIKQLKYIIGELEKDLDLYLTLKKINYYKTQPGSSKFKDVVTSRSNTIVDKFAMYKIKDEEYDNIIYAKHESLIAYQQRLLEKIRDIKHSDSRTYITYLREEERMTWEEISKVTHYSERQVRRIYGKK